MTQQIVTTLSDYEREIKRKISELAFENKKSRRVEIAKELKNVLVEVGILTNS